ncbi:MAG: OsmC family protein [Planctomycetota bacterium]
MSDTASGTRVSVRGSSAGFVQEIRAGEHTLLADEPLSSGGTDRGPAPHALLLAALGACTSMTVSMYARRKQWPLEDVRVALRHWKDDAGEHIERTIELEGALDLEQRARLLEIANKCPVHRTLTGPIDMRTQLG